MYGGRGFHGFVLMLIGKMEILYPNLEAIVNVNKLYNYNTHIVFTGDICPHELELIDSEQSVQTFTFSTPHLRSRMRCSTMKIDTLLAKCTWNQGCWLQTSHNIL